MWTTLIRGTTSALIRYRLPFIGTVIALIAMADYCNGQPANLGRPQRKPVYPFINSQYPIGLIPKVAWSQDSKNLYVASFDGAVYCYHIGPELPQPKVTPTRVLRWPISTTLGRIYDICVEPETGYVVVAGASVVYRSSQLVYFDPTTGLYPADKPPIALPKTEKTSVIRFVQFFGNNLIAVNEKGEIWNTNQMQKLADANDGFAAADQGNQAIEIFSCQTNKETMLVAYATSMRTYLRVLRLRKDATVAVDAQVHVVNGYARAVVAWDNTHAIVPIAKLAGNAGVDRELLPDRVDRINLTNGLVDVKFFDSQLLEPRAMSSVSLERLIGEIWSDSASAEAIEGQKSVEVLIGTQGIAGDTASNAQPLFRLTRPIRFGSVPIGVTQSPDGKQLCLTHRSEFSVLQTEGHINNPLVSVDWKAGGMQRYSQVGSTNAIDGTEHIHIRNLDHPERSIEISPRNGRVSSGAIDGRDFASLQLLDSPTRLTAGLVKVVIHAKDIQLEISDPVGDLNCFHLRHAEDDYILVSKYSGDVLLHKVFLKESRSQWMQTFSGHRNIVRSMGFLKQSKQLVGLADDGRLCIWSLQDLLENHVAGSVLAWGARFEEVNGAVIVQDIAPQSRLAHAGWKNGDKIVAVNHRNKERVESIPREVVSLLESTSAEDRFDFVTPKNTDPVTGPDNGSLGPYCLPLLSFLLDQDELEWAAWTSDGRFTASMVQGNNLFGWQFFSNKPEGQWQVTQPDFRTGRELYEQFYRPNLLQEILAAPVNAGPVDRAADTSHAIKLAQVQDIAPSVTIIEPAAGTTLPNTEATRIVARIKIPQPRQLTNFRLLATENKKPLGQPSSVAPQRNGDYEVIWQTSRLDIETELRVAVLPLTDGELCCEDAVTVFAAEPAPSDRRPQLYLMTLSVRDYDQAAWQPFHELEPGFKLPEDLRFCNQDAAVIAHKVFRTEKLKFNFNGDKSSLWQLEDDEVTSVAISKQFRKIEELFRQKRPEKSDLFVLFISGHGFGDATLPFHLIPKVPERSDGLSTLGISDRYAAALIPWSIFAEFLKGLPCRVLVILDACHSGRAEFHDVVHEAEMCDHFLLAACKYNEEAQEVQNGSNGALTTVLTIAVGEQGALDTDQNHLLSLSEIAVFTTDKANPTVASLTPGFTPEFKAKGRAADAIQLFAK